MELLARNHHLIFGEKVKRVIRQCFLALGKCFNGKREQRIMEETVGEKQN